jgi:hypothetical protein
MFINVATNHFCKPLFIGRNLSALTEFETQLKSVSGRPRSLTAGFSVPGRYLPNWAIGVVAIPPVEGGHRTERNSR